jgi:NADH-quinone oxidoreductase subunit G
MSAATIYVDGRPYSIEGAEGKNLLEACLSLGLDLPYFCWHPALHSAGACRQCAVKIYKDESDSRGRIAMACMTPVAAGLRASIDDPEARAFRAGVIEWLMINHPHDCPICDEGGECHLQDMTVMAGHVSRRYRFDKREHRSQDLGPFLAHEMNRCIQCYRCVRFYRDYAGGRDLDVLGWHDDVYFGRVAPDAGPEDGPLESVFSGNLCEVCPTGVFTDKTQAAHPSRKWDLHTSPSVCPHCGLGCSTSPAERYGELKRVRPRYNAEVNGYFLCDRGRFGQAYADSSERVASCLLGSLSEQGSAPREAAMEAARAALKAAAAPEGSAAIGVGSPRASLETNYALRALVGIDRFFVAMSDAEFSLHASMRDVLEAAGDRAASPREAELADAVLVLGEDVWNTAPILALRLRQASRNAPNKVAMREKRIPAWDDIGLREAVQERRGPFFVASPGPSPLDESAEASYRAADVDIARLGYAVASAIDAASPAPADLADAAASLARRIGAALLGAERPLVVSGSGLGSEPCVRAAAAVLASLLAAGKDARICLVFPEADSLGATMLGSGGLESALRALSAAAAQRHGSTVLLVAEADLASAGGGAGGAGARLMQEASTTIVLDHSESATTKAADIVLPSATILEGSGTFLSLEGRAQRFFALRKLAPPIQDSWRWLDELASAAGEGSEQRNLDGIDAAIAAELPELAAIERAAYGSSYRLLGRRIPRGARRESGRTSMYAALDVRDPEPSTDPDSSLSDSMEGPRSAPPSLLSRYWAPGWNSDQAINKFQDEVGGALKGGEIGSRVFASAPDLERLRGIAAQGAVRAALPPFEKRADSLLVLPRRFVFGSEALSARSPALASRIPEPRLFLSISDSRRLGLAPGAIAQLRFEAGGLDPLALPVAVADLPEGVAELPWGLAGLPHWALAVWASVKGAGEEKR